MNKISGEIKKDENRIQFILDSKVYSLEAIYSAAYTFIDKCYIYLDGDPKKELTVSLKGKNNLTKEELLNLEGEFRNELLNYLLRVEIASRNQNVREYIVGSALLSSLPNDVLDEPLTDDDGEEENWEEDPLDITTPWEEKYGKPLEELDLPSKIKDNLRDAKINSLEELKKKTKGDLLKIDGIGEKSVEKILKLIN